MPYQAWSEKKPDVSNLQEFGTPVWIKHQGQHLTKFEPKLRMMILVSYDEGSSSVKYYSAHTKRIRTSRNYHFLSLSNQPPPEPEPMEIDIVPEVLHEREKGNAVPNDTMSGIDKNQNPASDVPYGSHVEGKGPESKRKHEWIQDEEEQK